MIRTKCEVLSNRATGVYRSLTLVAPDISEVARPGQFVQIGVPEDRLVVETDCPFLPPHPHRGQRNEPAYVALTAARVAELRGAALDALGTATTRNAARLFRLSGT